MKIVEIRNLGVQYGETVALSDVNLDIYAQDFLG